MAQVKFQAVRRNVDLIPAETGGAIWGGVTIHANSIVWFSTLSLDKRLVVYFLRPGSPDPGPQYNSAVKTGALFLPAAEHSKWADLVYSGRSVYVRLETGAGHAHTVSTHKWW
jgi:hypothetical protein